MAAVLDGEAAGIGVGAVKLGGAALALFMPRDDFGFIHWNTERSAPKPESSEGYVEVLRELVECQNRQTEIQKRMETSQASILKINEQYHATGVCPPTRPLERQATIKALGREARRARG